MPRARITWKRRHPKRAAGRLAWTAFLAVAVCGPARLLFAGEPAQAADGAINPLALIVPALAFLFALSLVPQVIGLVRRPIVSADHYALTVRPGVARTLVLPWAQIAELAAMVVDEDAYLMVRCVGRSRSSGDRPRWWDQAHLRHARRGDATVTAYDLAVPMDDFLGTPDGLLRALSAYAPAHVTIVNAIRIQD